MIKSSPSTWENTMTLLCKWHQNCWKSLQTFPLRRWQKGRNVQQFQCLWKHLSPECDFQHIFVKIILWQSDSLYVCVLNICCKRVQLLLSRITLFFPLLKAREQGVIPKIINSTKKLYRISTKYQDLLIQFVAPVKVPKRSTWPKDYCIVNDSINIIIIF